MLRSSLVVRSKEMGDEAILHQGQVVALEGEMTCPQKLVAEL